MTSPLSEETLAMSMNEVLDEIYGLNKLLSLILGCTKDKPIHAVTDSMSLFDHTQTKKHVNNARLIVEISKIQESKDN